MSCLEKQHVSHKASMQHPSNLDSFMDETDREVMNLTDRAFKSLCIGDEAIYNDSELLPTPVDCHKPLAEEIPKKAQDNFALDVKKCGAHRPNGMYNRPGQIKNTSKVSSLFAAFAYKKNNDTKMTNGDSWDKSTLLSIQTELSEFSSDYQNHLRIEHSDQVKSHRKSTDKGTVNKSPQDISNSSRKSSKNQKSKSTKLRKLNSKNLFLHSEFSPFRSWGDLNRFGLDNVEMFPCSSPAGFYDSPVYREQNNSNILHVPEPNIRETSQSTSPLEPLHKSKLKFLPVPEKHSELNFPKLPDVHIETLQPQVLLMSSGSFQRCQSEGDICAPWRKSRNRSKGIVQPLISSPVCERLNTGEQGSVQNEKEVRTVEEATCLNSTPFNISQLLTPVIPSRQGTGTLEILQSVQSPADLDIPALHETEIRPSPDIKREGYKSKASSLLFNLKDNRKRVKATYSPPKFKVLDVVEQTKLSPLLEQVVTQNVLESPENTYSKTMSITQKNSLYPLSPETVDIQSFQSSGQVNNTLPDDFLGLSLLQAENKGSKKKHLAKTTYPSLNLYRKSSHQELNTKTMSVEVPGSHTTENRNSKQNVSEEHLPENDCKGLQIKHLTKPEITNALLIKPEITSADHVEIADKVLSEKTNAVALKEKHFPTVRKNHNAQQNAGSRNQDKLNAGGIFKAEERPIKYNEHHRKETKPKHFFSARQNNYIKNQRYVNVDDDDEECEYWQEDVISAVRDEPRKRELNVHMHKDKRKLQDSMDVSVTNDAFTKDNYAKPSKNVLGICTEQGVARNDALSMKGNTSAKIALFTLKEKPSNTVPGSVIKNTVRDKDELSTVALEKRIAEREHGKKLSDRHHGQDLLMKGEHKQDLLTSDQKETLGNVIPDSLGQKALSDFPPTSQKVQSMSDIDTNQGDCHVPKVKLAEPYKQEGTEKHSQSRLIYTDSDIDIDPSNNKSMANVTEIKKTVCMHKNVCLDQESSVVQNNIDNKLIRIGDDDSCIQKKAKIERINSVSEQRAINERLRKDDVGSVERSMICEEILSTDVKKSNLPKEKVKGHVSPVKGHVSSLMETFNREQVLASSNEKSLSQVDGLMGYSGNDLLKEKAISPKDIMGFSEVEELLTEHKAREIESDKELSEKESKYTMGTETVKKDVTRNEEDKKDVARRENEDASDILIKTDQNQTKSKCQGESSVKWYLTDNSEKSNEPDHDSKKTPPSNLLNADNAPMDRITLYDILNQAETSSLIDDKQLEQGNLPSKLSVDSSFSHKTEESPSLNKGKERKCEHLDTIHSNSIPESKQHPLNDVENGGWVRCLIESSRNLTPTCQSNVSSPTLGKPALFKVKDNTFSASPVTKTVRPILHKTVARVTQPWSPRESLSGSERGEEDLFKDLVDLQCPTLSFTPVQITQPIQVVHRPSSQSTTDLERTGLMDNSTVPEEEGWQLTISSDGIESHDMSALDTVEDLAFNNVPTDSIQESKAPSERSDSACSGIENQLQGKPPAVPPKTEKALRRAMKLTTKRIQKAEAKSKSERGRSSEKGSCQNRERRYQSSDKILSNRSYQREHSIHRAMSNKSTEENNSETSMPKRHTSERLATESNKPNRCLKKKDSGRKPHDCHSSLLRMDGDAKSSMAEKQKENQSHHKDQFDTQNINVDCERLGRTSEKYLPHKLYRRAHSLDRFSSGKYEHRVFISEDPASKTNTETLKTLTTAQKAPLRQNSTEHTYSSSANNMVSQSFPMTQRKLLQDLDSGQYFVVDMPVQVKTKTFFDPETGSYVQLPVQSLEGSVPRAQSVEVVNAPPLMLYHGFVPVPVSSLP
ncbi:hypothetical protein KOW79_011767 [Hemibagrus wyckioides]|uniref:DUF4585 domain-containing protein n=1 Tax=Hemibagrus wyckioides TaxID=337641 RepID=A0A9D3NKV3_9TELE|nr:uncharacterized protein LOC131363313 [Hemibagrus wyckioides]KAG7325451.1 hypothetical protein KOW79_011767 [Hemibagrus wyckioides]